jgi:predicted GNAT superfamily acetyltransferase
VHAGLGTDRFIVDWELAGAGPREIAPRPDAPIANPVDASGTPATVGLPDADVVRVLVPPDIFAVLASAPAVAHAWRATTRRAFEWYLGRGYRVAGFDRGDPSGFPAYIITR